LVKHIFESLQDDYETLAFQGEQLDRKNIEQIFSEHPFDFSITLDKVLDSPAFNKKKILLIDSIEKVLETSNADTILDFFELLSKRQDIILVLTCRSYAIEQLKIRFLRHFPPFPHFEVPMLTGPELTLVAETYPVIKP
jgi:DNA polymerase III delta subunit